MSLQRLLIISYLFPPAGGVGVQRALNFAKYLPGCGFEVHVLHAKNPAVPVQDPELIQQIPKSVVTHRAFTPEIPFGARHAMWRMFAGRQTPKSSTAASPKIRSSAGGLRQLPLKLIRRALSPEPEILWVPFAIRRARQIIRRHEITALLVTVPPFSALLAGTALKREFPHLKLISDFRDDWMRFYLGNFEYQEGDHARRRAAQIERESIETSDLVVAVTGSTLDDIRARYPEQADSKFAVIHNGYDPAAFTTLHSPRPVAETIVVTHVGTIYGASSAREYVEAVESLPPALRERVASHFIGRVTAEEQAAFGDRAASFTLAGFQPHSRALQSMERADFLLLIMKDKATLPGKLFEYLATGKPILAIAPRGSEVEQLIRKTRAGWCAPADDPGALRAMLIEAFSQASRSAVARDPDWSTIRRFERPRLARELGELITAINPHPATVSTPVR